MRLKLKLCFNCFVLKTCDDRRSLNKSLRIESLDSSMIDEMDYLKFVL